MYSQENIKVKITVLIYFGQTYFLKLKTKNTIQYQHVFAFYSKYVLYKK